MPRVAARGFFLFWERKTKAMKRFLAGLAALALCIGLLAGCGQPAPSESTAQGPQLLRFSTVFYDVFDTVTTVAAYCESEEEFTAQTEALHADLLEYHKLYDIYHEYDGLVNMATLNRTAANGPVQVDDRIFAMLQEAVQLYELTGGKMNIAMGRVLKLWHDFRENESQTPPAEAALQAAAEHIRIADLVLDEAEKTVFYADPQLLLDVGSCGKGYACEMAARSAEARGLTSATISVGGNIRCIGQKPTGSEWTIGIELPWSDPALAAGRDYVCAMYTSDLAAVTSGDYQRFVTIDGVRYHHLIDPATLQPARYFSSVTILCADSGLADCLSTGVFCTPLEQGMALVEGLEGVEALWCLPDGTTRETSGWADHKRPE